MQHLVKCDLCYICVAVQQAYCVPTPCYMLALEIVCNEPLYNKIHSAAHSIHA